MLPLIALQPAAIRSACWRTSCACWPTRRSPGFKVREDRSSAALDRNPILVTALNPVIGYEKAAAIAKHAYKEGPAGARRGEGDDRLPEKELRKLARSGGADQGRHPGRAAVAGRLKRRRPGFAGPPRGRGRRASRPTCADQGRRMQSSISSWRHAGVGREIRHRGRQLPFLREQRRQCVAQQPSPRALHAVACLPATCASICPCLPDSDAAHRRRRRLPGATSTPCSRCARRFGDVSDLPGDTRRASFRCSALRASSCRRSARSPWASARPSAGRWRRAEFSCAFRLDLDGHLVGQRDDRLRWTSSADASRLAACRRAERGGDQQAEDHAVIVIPARSDAGHERSAMAGQPSSRHGGADRREDHRHAGDRADPRSA